MSTTARVLVVVSAADRIPLREGGQEPTGTYLGELTEPTDAMLEAGFELGFATPGGKVPTIDKTSYTLMYWNLSRAKLDAAKRSHKRLVELGLANPIPLEEIAHDRERLAEFDAMFVPGGHAPMSTCSTAIPWSTTRSTRTSQRWSSSSTKPDGRPG